MLSDRKNPAMAVNGLKYGTLVYIHSRTSEISNANEVAVRCNMFMFSGVCIGQWIENCSCLLCME